MQSDLWQRRVGWVCFVAIVLIGGALAQSNVIADDEPGTPPPPPPRRPLEGIREQSELVREIRQAAQRGEFDRVFALSQQAFGGETGKYWLGIESREVQPELRAQLGLADGVGLAVMQVAEGSAAAKAGLKRHDVIVSAGDAKTGRVADLTKALDVADGKELTLKILRGGKEQTLAVTPVERPQDQFRIISRPGMGMILGDLRAELPENVTVAIVRQGNKPAKVTVSRGDEKWELSEDELNKLPDDLRPAVGRMLGGLPAIRGAAGPMGRLTVDNRIGQIRVDPMNEPMPQERQRGQQRREGRQGGEVGAPGAPDGPLAQRGPGNRGGEMPQAIMQRLEQLDRRLEMLQEQIRGLREGGMPRERLNPERPGGLGRDPAERGERRPQRGDGDRRGPPREGNPPPGQPGGPVGHAPDAE